MISDQLRLIFRLKLFDETSIEPDLLKEPVHRFRITFFQIKSNCKSLAIPKLLSLYPPTINWSTSKAFMTTIQTITIDSFTNKKSKPQNSVAAIK